MKNTRLPIFFLFISYIKKKFRLLLKELAIFTDITSLPKILPQLCRLRLVVLCSQELWLGRVLQILLFSLQTQPLSFKNH